MELGDFASPRMRRVMQNNGVSFCVQELQRARDTQWEWSVFDFASMQAGLFDNVVAGAAAIRDAERVAGKSVAADAGAGRTVAAGSSSKGAFGGVKPKAMFVEPKVKKASYELGENMRRISGQAAELSETQQHAVSIIEYMSDNIKQKYLPGKQQLPPEQQDYLIFQGVSHMAGKDTLRNIAAALRRLDAWVSGVFTSDHGFQIDTAIVAWFLSDMSIGEDEHVPQQLVTGLRTAANELHFPIRLNESIIRHIARPPTRTPKQAPSSSVRVFYHFWQVASDRRLSQPLRAMAGAFAVMCVSALRGIDAQRSSFDMRHKARNGYEFFSAFLTANRMTIRILPYGLYG